MALPSPQKLARVFPASPRLVVEDDNLRTGFQVVAAVSPKVGLFGFAAAGIELGYRGLIGMKRTAFQ